MVCLEKGIVLARSLQPLFTGDEPSFFQNVIRMWHIVIAADSKLKLLLMILYISRKVTY